VLPPSPLTLPGCGRFGDRMRGALGSEGALVVHAPDRASLEVIGSVARKAFEDRGSWTPTDSRYLLEQPPARQLAGILKAEGARTPRSLIEAQEDPVVVWVEVQAPLSDTTTWWDFVRQVANENRKLGPDPRLTLIIGTCVDSGWTDDSDNSHVAARWWWNVFDRLDSLVALRRAVDASEVVLETAAEVAQFDLNLAIELARHAPAAGLDADTVEDLLGPPHPDTPPAYASAIASDAERPMSESMDGWRAGALGFWDGSEQAAVGRLGVDRRSEIEHRVWKAQLRALFPDVETSRRTVASWVKANRHLFGVDVLDDAIEHDKAARQEIQRLSAGSLAHLIRGLDPSVHSRRRSLAHDLRDVRNALAHGDSIDQRHLERLKTLGPQIDAAFASAPERSKRLQSPHGRRLTPRG
jgi:hypothetical protein